MIASSCLESRESSSATMLSIDLTASSEIRAAFLSAVAASVSTAERMAAFCESLLGLKLFSSRASSEPASMAPAEELV